MSHPDARPRAVFADALTRLVAEADIRALILRAALLGDSGNPEDYSSIYSVDAIWHAATHDVGLLAIIDSTRERRRAGIGGPGSDSKHLVNVMSMDFTEIDRAQVISYFMFVVDTSSTPRIARVGTYTDQVVHSDSEWRITTRMMSTG